MIYTLCGKLVSKKDGFIVVDVRGVGYQVFAPKTVLEKLPGEGGEVNLFCFMNVKEDGIDLFGFLEEKERKCFEMLTSVSGVGPRTAARILDIATVEQLSAAVEEGKADLLTKASGVGRKTAERVIIELRGKMNEWANKETAKTMESDIDIVEALVNLGYGRNDIRSALKQIDGEATQLEERLRAALKLLKK